MVWRDSCETRFEQVIDNPRNYRFQYYSSSKCYVQAILSSTPILYHLQDLAFFQCFDIIIAQGILLVIGVLNSLCASPHRDLESISTDLATVSVFLYIILELRTLSAHGHMRIGVKVE